MNTQIQLIETDPGYFYEVVKIEIFSGVHLEIYRDEGYPDEATLIIGDNPVHFACSEDAEELFNNLDTCEPIELLTILAQAPRLLA